MKLNYSDILKNQPIFNIGSIGHVAHGKSTLVKSITGVKTQKYSSEQERNITIHIGYANTKIFLDKNGQLHTTPSKKESLIDSDGNEMTLVGHVSFVDVPGHEAFMSNMISGAAVMHACILVIASNEPIPQPQTYEHFQAVKNVNIKDFIILQNKLDLVEESSNDTILNDIKKFVQGTVAEKSPIIPSSIQNDINKDEILRNILNLSNKNNIKTLNERANEDLKMIVIRSFDINNPNIVYNNLEGGVVGGSLISGNLKIGDYIEMRPGFVVDGKYRPIYSRVISLQSDTKKLDYALPGGLVGICLDIDPSLTKSNLMVGQILGHVGKLPNVYNEIYMSFDEISRHDSFMEKFKTNEDVLLSINSMNIKAIVTKCKNKKNLISFKLLTPVCVFTDQKIAIFKLKSTNWILYATGKFIEGVECEKNNIENSVYESLLDKNTYEPITIINDFATINACMDTTCQSDTSPDLNNSDDNIFNIAPYSELIKNISFRDNKSVSLRIEPPIVKKVNRDSIFTNYSILLDNINKTAKDINYDNIFMDFLKDETSTTCDIGKGGIAIRGNFRNNHIQNIIIKFYKKYKMCNICNSCDSFLIRENRLLFKKCIDCNSQSCI
jgi:translation initiation factor 2 subunit 3